MKLAIFAVSRRVSRCVQASSVENSSLEGGISITISFHDGK